MKSVLLLSLITLWGCGGDTVANYTDEYTQAVEHVRCQSHGQKVTCEAINRVSEIITVLTDNAQDCVKNKDYKLKDNVVTVDNNCRGDFFLKVEGVK